MKYSKDLVDKIIKYIESGATNEDAAAMAGICESTFYRWLSDDEDNPLNEEEKSEFSESMHRAEARRRTVLANRIIKATEDGYLKDVDGKIVKDKNGQAIVVKRGEWRAAAFYLERTAPETYAKKSEIKHSGDLRGRIIVEKLPKEVKDALRHAFREALKKGKPKDSGGTTG